MMDNFNSASCNFRNTFYISSKIGTVRYTYNTVHIRINLACIDEIEQHAVLTFKRINMLFTKFVCPWLCELFYVLVMSFLVPIEHARHVCMLTCEQEYSGYMIAFSRIVYLRVIIYGSGIDW